MKRLLSFFAIAMLLFASCEKNEVIPSGANDVAVRFTANLQGQLGSKAISDGLTVDQLIFGVFQKDAQGNYFEVESLRQNDVVVSNGKANVSTSLIKGETYTFVFWAQKKDAGHYNTADLTAIEVNYSVANDESRDAFTAVEKDIVVNGAIAKDIVLKRPFAQINFGTTKSDWNAVTVAGANYTESKLWVSGVADVYDAFAQVATAESASTIEIEFEKTAMPAQDLTVEGVDYKYLSMNYILVPETEDAADNAMVEVVMTVDGHKSPIKLSNVPVKENYRTNVVGNLLSSTADFNIIVDEEYAGETNYDMLQLILANGGTYKLTGDIEISEALVAKADVILDLNGYSIKSTAGIYVPGQVVALICADGEGVDLIIEDSSADQSGVVDAVAFEDYAVEARNGATLTIKGGNFKGDITAIQAYNGSVVNIYGGVFEATPYNSTYWVLNIAQPAGSVDSEMNVYGGQFKNFNPSAPKVDSPDLSYVPEGYMVNQAGEMYIVSKTPVIENGVAEISDLGGLLWLQDMVISGNVMSDVTVKLTQDVDLNGIEWNPIGDYGATNNRFAGTFDGQGHVISNLDTYHYSSAGLFGGVTSTAIIKNVTLKDVNINSNRYTGGIVAYCSGGNAQILNCHVEGGTITSVPHVSGSSYNDGDKVGGIAGHFTGTIDGCSVKGVTITAYRDLGGICGRAAYAAVVVTNNHVENVSIVQDNTNAYKNGVQTTYGEICGDFKGSAENYTGNTFVNVTLSSVN